MLEIFADFSPEVHALISLAEKVMVSPSFAFQKRPHPNTPSHYNKFTPTALAPPRHPHSPQMITSLRNPPRRRRPPTPALLSPRRRPSNRRRRHPHRPPRPRHHHRPSPLPPTTLPRLPPRPRRFRAGIFPLHGRVDAGEACRAIDAV